MNSAHKKELVRLLVNPKQESVLFEVVQRFIGSSPDRCVTTDHRQIDGLGPKPIFFAIEGSHFDGHSVVDSALLSKCSAVFIERTVGIPSESSRNDIIQVTNTRKALSLVCAIIADIEFDKIKIVGVTGTAGKTTITYLIESVFKQSELKTGVIGTVNFRCGEKVYPSTHTSPGPIELFSLLKSFEADGCQALAIEVSSHALKQDRLFGLPFDGMIFSNLSQDHLDYHHDFEDYYQSKKRLFTEHFAFSEAYGKSPQAVAIARDPYSLRLIQEVSYVHAIDIGKPGMKKSITLDGIHFSFSTAASEDAVDVESPFLGGFNFENLYSVAYLMLHLGFDPFHISKGLSDLELVPGRLERVLSPNLIAKKIHVFVDYAHKPEALEKVLETLKELLIESSRSASRSAHTNKDLLSVIKGEQSNPKLITVFGCGGDRDRKKRPIMGEIAARLSDQVIITSDNPRTEDPLSIITEICLGITDRAHMPTFTAKNSIDLESLSHETLAPRFALAHGKEHVRIISDRKEAIFMALSMAHTGDVVLIAGKGHEDYQVIGTTKHPFSDVEVVKNWT